MRGRIQTIADTLLDQVQEQGHMDLINDYAFPLPLTVITEMLGIPVADRDRFHQWSNATVTPILTEAESVVQGRLIKEFTTYLEQCFTERRRHPQDDLLTALLQAEEVGDTLNRSELFGTVILLTVAGHETTVNLIGNAMLTLFQHPEQLSLLKAQPALMAAAVEEFLRYDGPLERATFRVAAEDVTIGDKTIRRGDPVVAVIAAANRDPAQFACPHKFDLNREHNPHLGFGFGVHYCLGASLARMEGEIALNTLLRRMPNIRLKVPASELTWKPIPFLRGLEAMPVMWT